MIVRLTRVFVTQQRRPSEPILINLDRVVKIEVADPARSAYANARLVFENIEQRRYDFVYVAETVDQIDGML